MKKNLEGKEFIGKCLAVFSLDPNLADCFEVIIIKLDCKISSSNLLRFEDEHLLLRENKLNKTISEAKIAKDDDQEEFSQMSNLQENFQEYFNLEDHENIQEITMFKGADTNEDDFSFEEDREDIIEEENSDNPNEDQEEENIYEEEIEIDIDEIIKGKFINRDNLKEKVIKEWGGKNKLNLNFRTQERILIKDDAKVSVILCSKKDMLGCPFYLEFRTNSEQHYTLTSFCNVHNHTLNKYDTIHGVNEEIIETIKSSRSMAKSMAELTTFINEKFKKNFHRLTIYNLSNKLKDDEFGKINEDAKMFIQVLEEDHKKREGFYQAKFNDKTLEGCCYMSKRMNSLLDYFSDVIIIDVSHGTNRFLLPFLDIVIINNYGQTCLCYFSLLPNQRYVSFQWSLENFRSQLNRTSQVIFSDDEEALRKGIYIYIFAF